jgi:tetratricopeptide (TPR) repeat protein
LEAKHDGDFKLAVEKLATAAAYDPESEEPLSALAAAQLSMCNPTESAKTADKILALNPNSAEGLSLKAEAKAYSRDYNSMMTYYERPRRRPTTAALLALAEKSFVFFEISGRLRLWPTTLIAIRKTFRRGAFSPRSDFLRTIRSLA